MGIWHYCCPTIDWAKLIKLNERVVFLFFFLTSLQDPDKTPLLLKIGLRINFSPIEPFFFSVQILQAKQVLYNFIVLQNLQTSTMYFAFKSTINLIDWHKLIVI